MDTYDELVDLVCDVLTKHPNESVRQRAQALHVADHGRRLRAQGKHPITGESKEEYEEAIAKARGAHPVTGDTSWPGGKAKAEPEPASDKPELAAHKGAK